MPLVVYSPGVNAQTAESVLFQPVDNTNRVHQPNFTRWRHRLRGPRESYKINLEMDQFYYDIQTLKIRYDIVRDNLDYITGHYTEGGAMTGVEVAWELDATPGEEDLVLEGLNNLSARIESLRERVRKLEG